jgi:hypothetical protein
MSTDDLAKPLQLKVKLLKSVEAPKWRMGFRVIMTARNRDLATFRDYEDIFKFTL